MKDSVSPVSPTSFRIDKYLVNEINGFNSQIRLFNGGAEGPDDKLIRNIIYSVASDYEHNLMGFGQLDPAQFAKSWKYDPAFLRRRVDNPYQLSLMTEAEVAQYRIFAQAGKSPDGEKYWDSRLENALFILSTRPISFDRYGEFSRSGDNEQEKVEVRSHASFTLFSNLSSVTRGHGKTIYTYTLNENFERNLTRYYIRGEKESLLDLRATGLDSLYLYLVNLRTNLAINKVSITTPGELPDFEYLCHMAGIRKTTDGGAPVPMKERKRQLAAALARIDKTTELHLKVEWVSLGGGRDRFVPVINFGTAHLLGMDTTWGAGKIAQWKEQTSIQQQFLMRSLLDMYKKICGRGLFLPEDEARFREWAVCPDLNRKEKETALRMAYIGIFRQIPRNEADITEAFFALMKGTRSQDLAAAVARFEIKADLVPEKTLDNILGRTSR